MEFLLGEDWDQQKTFIPEQKGKFDSYTLEQVAEILKIRRKRFGVFMNRAINVISNTYDDCEDRNL